MLTYEPKKYSRVISVKHGDIVIDYYSKKILGKANPSMGTIEYVDSTNVCLVYDKFGFLQISMAEIIEFSVYVVSTSHIKRRIVLLSPNKEFSRLIKLK